MTEAQAERVARAIHKVKTPTPFEWLPPRCKEMYLDMARAAVAEYESETQPA